MNEFNQIDNQGFKQGVWINYYNQKFHKPISQANYINDKMYGLYIFFSVDGGILNIINFVKGSQEGESLCFL